MHGLINRSIQGFLRDTYGADFWMVVSLEARLGFDNFEAMLSYEDGLTEDVLTAAAGLLGRPREAMLEDLGTYLVSHHNFEPLRRLLRFGGVTFTDFLHSLDDLPSRARLAVPELALPQMELMSARDSHFALHCAGGLTGFGHVMVGVLRAMADDYGTLALLEHDGTDGGVERISIQVLEPGFAEGRHFSLAARAV